MYPRKFGYIIVMTLETDKRCYGDGTMSNIVIALRKIEDAKKLRVILERHGMAVTAVCSSAASALSFVSVLEAGILICGYRLPDMGFLELQECLNEDFELLVLASAKYAEEISASENALYMALPMREAEFVNTVSLILEQLEQKRRQQKKPKIRSQEEKNCIANAKLFLMKQQQITEEEAYRFLQKSSMDAGEAMAETAKRILGEQPK